MFGHSQEQRLQERQKRLIDSNYKSLVQHQDDQHARVLNQVCPPPPHLPANDCSDLCHERNHSYEKKRPISRTNLTKISKISSIRRQKLLTNLLKLFIVNTILGHLDILGYISKLTTANDNQLPYEDLVIKRAFAYHPKILLADAIECKLDGDCGSREKICHENKCICARDRPIEDQDRCLPQALIKEACEVNEQCMGSSTCIDGICSCGNDGITLLNPSINIYYCHPKRQLGQECNYDVQCPDNSYCSTAKYGCVCQNGYKPDLTANPASFAGCVPKTCTNSSTCESEFHQCNDGMCICLATHFDINSGQCYKFGSTGGKPLDETKGSNLTSSTTSFFDLDNNFYSTFKDLIRNSDNMWLVLIVLIALTIILFTLIFILIRKHYLGYCWTAHKNEYAPNNKNAPKNDNFNKNSINNKSFRKKNGELDDDDDEKSAEDRAALVPPALNGKSSNKTDKGYVKVNIGESLTSGASADSSTQYHHQLSPLASSTSTPV